MIIFKQGSTVPFGLLQDDKPANDVVSDLFSECSLSFEKYRPSCIALGSRQGTKPRPIKVTFQTEADKWEALKVINREKPTGVFARLDLNREEQEQDFRLRQELKKVRAENQMARTKYTRIRSLKWKIK
jgi:hypothetical protein